MFNLFKIFPMEDESYNQEYMRCPWCGVEEKDSWEIYIDGNGKDTTVCSFCNQWISVEAETTVWYTARKLEEGIDKELIFDGNGPLVGCRYFNFDNVLQITFKDGKTYQFFDVPMYVHGEMLKAASRQEYYQENIVGKYRYARSD